MSDENTAIYHRGREQRECNWAANAINPTIATIRRDMADRYRDLVATVAPMLRLRA